MKRAFAATVNFLIAVITIWCWIAILAAVTDMGSPLMAGGLYSLKFFTTLSNLFNGAACAATSIVLMLGKTPSQGLRTWKLAGTSAVGLTFLTVMGFLGSVDRVTVELVRAVDNIVSVVLVRLDPGLGSSGVHC